MKDLKRIYVLEYIHHPHGKWGGGEGEKKQFLYTYRQRQEFIDEYLIALANDYAYSDIHCYYASYGNNEIKDMNMLIQSL